MNIKLSPSVRARIERAARDGIKELREHFSDPRNSRVDWYFALSASGSFSIVQRSQSVQQPAVGIPVFHATTEADLVNGLSAEWIARESEMSAYPFSDDDV